MRLYGNDTLIRQQQVNKKPTTVIWLKLQCAGHSIFVFSWAIDLYFVICNLAVSSRKFIHFFSFWIF